jgi:hypothetical protein
MFKKWTHANHGHLRSALALEAEDQPDLSANLFGIFQTARSVSPNC